jgi:cephalosporin hydroxylase
MNPEERFALERLQRLEEFSDDARLKTIAHDWVFHSMQQKYLYNFDWLGRPIIQYPEDMVAIQELIWKVKPTLVIETGIAHGGSLVLSASMLAMLDYCEAVEAGSTLDPRKSRRKVVGIDIDIRSHNRSAIEAHPLAGLISMVEGSSVDCHVIDEVHQLATGHETVMVFMDSNHTHEHVLGELNAYAHLVTKGSYCVVFDTFVEDMPPKYFPDRPWDKGDSPKTAVREYLKSHSEFEIDKSIDNKLLISVAPDGYLLRIS